MFNAKILKWLTLSLVFVMMLSWKVRVVGAADNRYLGEKGMVRTIVPENLISNASDKREMTLTAQEDVQGETEAEKWNFTPEEMDLFAQLVHAEANGESYRGKVAVAAAILNRIECDEYPDDLAAVIFQVESGYYQFSPVKDGSIWMEPDQDAYRAIRDAINGEDPSNGAISFYNPRKTANQWVREQPVTNVIGNHIFFKLAE